MDWSLAGASEAGGNPAATLVLTDSDYTRAMWPHAFKARQDWVGGGGGVAKHPPKELRLLCKAGNLSTVPRARAGSWPWAPRCMRRLGELPLGSGGHGSRHGLPHTLSFLAPCL